MTATATCKACHTNLDPAKSRGEKNGYRFLPCITCSTITVDPFPSFEQLMAFYQSYKGSAVYTHKQEKKIRRGTKRIRRLMKRTPGRRFLDVGCNQGYTVKAALDLGLDAMGIDIDKVAVDTARSLFGEHFEALAVQDLARHGKKVDILYTSEVIEHVPDPDSFVRALGEILEKSGVLYLTTPDGGHWTVPQNFAACRFATPPSHIIYFTQKGLRTLLERHGFIVENFFFSFRKPGIRLIARKI